MKLTVSFRGIKPHAAWEKLAESQLEGIQAITSIESAHVTLERQRESKPPFRVRVHLVVPGPDFHAEAQDHTLQAAVIKTVKSLERKIRNRLASRADRWKTNLQLGVAPQRSTNAATQRI